MKHSLIKILPALFGVICAQAQSPVVTIAATSPSAKEAGPVQGVFSVTRSGATTFPLTVNFSDYSSSANPSNDYTRVPGGWSVTIPAGSSWTPITLTPSLDTNVEGTEQVNFALSTGYGYTIGTNWIATVTIADAPVVSISAGVAAGEPSTAGTFTVSRTGPTTAALTVNLGFSGTALAGADYTPSPGTNSVTIPAGASSAVVTINPINDNGYEGTETVVATISSGLYAIATSSASISLTDEDNRVSVTATVASASEVGPVSGQFNVTRIGPTTSALVVNLGDYSSTASFGTDYSRTPSGWSVTIPAGQTFTTLTVTPIPDLLVEGNEQVNLTVSSGSNYDSPSNWVASVIISDAPVVSVAAGTVAGEPAQPGSFSVSRTGSTTSALVVNVSLTGTAVSSQDYTRSPSGTSITIPAGASSATLTINPIDDSQYEGNETIVATITAGSYMIGTGTVTANFTDNEQYVTVVADAASVVEGGSGTNFRIQRLGPTTSSLTVYLAWAGTATWWLSSGNDCTLSSSASSIVIPAGANQATITLTPLQDNLNEVDEMVLLSIQPNSGYVVGAPDKASVRIVDDELFVRITSTDSLASRRGPTVNPGSVTVSRNGTTTSNLVVTVMLRGTAVLNTDYTVSGITPSGTNWTVTIPTGSDSATFTVTPVAGTDESLKTVVVWLWDDPSLSYGVESWIPAKVYIYGPSAWASRLEDQAGGEKHLWFCPPGQYPSSNRSGTNAANPREFIISLRPTCDNTGTAKYDYPDWGYWTHYQADLDAALMRTPYDVAVHFLPGTYAMDPHYLLTYLGRSVRILGETNGTSRPILKLRDKAVEHLMGALGTEFALFSNYEEWPTVLRNAVKQPVGFLPRHWPISLLEIRDLILDGNFDGQGAPAQPQWRRHAKVINLNGNAERLLVRNVIAKGAGSNGFLPQTQDQTAGSETFPLMFSIQNFGQTNLVGYNSPAVVEYSEVVGPRLLHGGYCTGIIFGNDPANRTFCGRDFAAAKDTLRFPDYWPATRTTPVSTVQYTQIRDMERGIALGAAWGRKIAFLNSAVVNAGTAFNFDTASMPQSDHIIQNNVFLDVNGMNIGSPGASYGWVGFTNFSIANNAFRLRGRTNATLYSNFTSPFSGTWATPPDLVIGRLMAERAGGFWLNGGTAGMIFQNNLLTTRDSSFFSIAGDSPTYKVLQSITTSSTVGDLGPFPYVTVDTTSLFTYENKLAGYNLDFRNYSAITTKSAHEQDRQPSTLTAFAARSYPGRVNLVYTNSSLLGVDEILIASPYRDGQYPSGVKVPVRSARQPTGLNYSTAITTVWQNQSVRLSYGHNTDAFTGTLTASTGPDGIATFQVPYTSGNGLLKLTAWVDLDGNGVFDPDLDEFSRLNYSEGNVVSVAAGSDVLSDRSATAGKATLVFTRAQASAASLDVEFETQAPYQASWPPFWLPTQGTHYNFGTAPVVTVLGGNRYRVTIPSNVSSVSVDLLPLVSFATQLPNDGYCGGMTVRVVSAAGYVPANGQYSVPIALHKHPLSTLP